MDEFPAGRVPLLLLVFAVLSGGVVAVRSARTVDYDLTIWTFAHVNHNEYLNRLKDLAEPGAVEGLPDRDRIHLLNLGRASTDRLALAVMSGTGLPDLVEIEQSEVGRYFRGPLEGIPFVDLTDRIHQEGWHEKCVRARFLKYSTRGRIFGLPHDLHPMVVVYQPRVLADLGLSPEQLTLWDDWVAAAGVFHRPGEPGTPEWRYGLALSMVEAYDFLILLWQRGGDVFDGQDRVVIDNDLAVDTLEFYVSLFRSDPPLAGSKLSTWTEDFGALARGQFVALIVPDWMLATMQLDARSLLEGKLRCMPMPAWEPGGRRTSTVGGTMIGIPKSCQDVEAAWRMAKFLYFDRESLVKRFRDQTILPPLKTAYDDPVFAEPVEFFGGQPVGRLLTELADEVPPVHGGPYTAEAFVLLNAVFADVMEGRIEPRAALTRVADELRASRRRDQLTVESAGARSQ